VTSTVDALPDAMEVVADKANISILADWAEGWATAHGLDSNAAFAMRLCMEEAVTNIVLYAYEPENKPGTVAAAASLGSDGVLLTIADQGRPFDVAAARDDGREGDIASATIGGRGIRLMREFSDRLEYARDGDQNRLSLAVTVAGLQCLIAGESP
jgi:anti-sigma regulatory factor (Ser/Thr protein kinase)